MAHAITSGDVAQGERVELDRTLTILLVGVGGQGTILAGHLLAMTAAEAGAAVGAVGFFTLIEGLICLLQGVLGLRAAKDSRKVMPVWIIAVIGLAAGIISLVMTVFRGGVDASQYGSLIGSVASSALMFWLANNIRKQNA